MALEPKNNPDFKALGLQAVYVSFAVRVEQPEDFPLCVIMIYFCYCRQCIRLS